MKPIKAVRDFASDLGISELPGLWIIIGWMFAVLRIVIIRACDAIIMLWEPGWKPSEVEF